MNAPDVHLLTGAYAANALSPEERADFERHLQECPACAQEVAELAATTARIAAAVAEPAPAALRDRVMDQIQVVRQLPPVVGGAGRRAARRWYAKPVSVAAAVALVVLAGLAAVTLDSMRRADQAEERADRIAAIATDPDRVVVEGRVAGGGTATLVAAEGQALFSARDLPPAPPGRTYQLWVIGDGAPRSAGLLEPRGSRPSQVLVSGFAARDSLGLTVEPSGGSKRPTTKPVVMLNVAS